jgi:uncharacterized protein (TIGR02147 family)
MQTESLLKKEFIRRKSKNPSYSLRAFSQSIGIPSGRLSEILNGKRRLTKAYAGKILNNLRLDLIERKKWLNAIAGVPTDTQSLDESQFCLIADPIHFALLCLFETKGFEIFTRSKIKSKKTIDLAYQIQWLAERLEKPKLEVELAIQNLLKLQYISIENNLIQLTLDKALETTTDVPSNALQESHRKSLLSAVSKIESVPVELRDVTSTTMAIDINNLPKAKKLIREFRKNLSALLEDGSKEEVYELNVQLIPLTKVKSSL